MYIDSHAHVEAHKFDSDRLEMLARAREAGLERILAIGSGTGPGTYDCALEIAEQHDWIFASTGLHPHEASVATEADYAEMERLWASVLPALPLYQELRVDVAPQALADLQPPPSSAPLSWNVYRWTFAR